MLDDLLIVSIVERELHGRREGERSRNVVERNDLVGRQNDEPSQQFH